MHVTPFVTFPNARRLIFGGVSYFTTNSREFSKSPTG
ncbi:hypothetical protein cgp_2788 [Corynebacterium glutamicum MB001]|nr:hypothetical protein cgp_2788 [Corynebacterium glutamicum MB001]ASW14850.1 hypothetical protein cgc1_2788 [Corynebacterium glutamicum]QYO74496.1 hypothetical protein cgisf_2788 [Corynebacterium glutamicum]